MKVILHHSIETFLNTLDAATVARALRLIALLEELGSAITMPHSKPIGRGLFELRVTGRSAVRLLYGFCKGNAVIVFGITKKTKALSARDVALARERLKGACAL